MAAGSSKGRKIVVLCEGKTEEIAIQRFVRRQWDAEGHGSAELMLINLKGKLLDIGRKTPRFLDGPDVLAVFTLIDLYGTDRVQHSAEDSLGTKVKRVQDWLTGQFQHPRARDFYPHLGVHETEAWLLAEGVALAKRLNDSNLRPDPHAESKDLQRPPSKIINDLFLTRRGDRYQKILDGGPLFAAAQFQPVYETCRYFRSFYDDLKHVAAG